MPSAVNVHVDDFRALDCLPSLTARLRDALVERFTDVTVHEQSTSFVGIQTTQFPNGAVLCSQDAYIARVASVIGVAHLPPVDFPAEADFFMPSSSLSDCVPVLPAVYSSLTGHLIQALQTRDEIRNYVSHLCSKNSSPNEGDYSKAIHVLRYLASTPGVGRVFKADAVEIVVHSDAAFMLHAESGRSSGAFFLSVGVHNAPFHSEAKIQDYVATCPMTSEYMAAGASCKSIVHYRQLAADLGWPQSGPTCVVLDSKTAISLVVAPEITRKSRHIEAFHHYIRELASRGMIFLRHVKSELMRADVMTKYLPRARFLLSRDGLLNTKAQCG